MSIVIEYIGNRAERVLKKSAFAPPEWRVLGNRRDYEMYAIIETGGKQYKVEQGDFIFVEKLNVEAGETITFDKVLVVGGDDLKVGAPYVDGATVSANVVKNGKDKKIIVYKYKPKKGYHKKQGHRQPYTKVEITAINA